MKQFYRVKCTETDELTVTQPVTEAITIGMMSGGNFDHLTKMSIESVQRPLLTLLNWHKGVKCLH